MDAPDNLLPLVLTTECKILAVSCLRVAKIEASLPEEDRVAYGKYIVTACNDYMHMRSALARAERALAHICAQGYDAKIARQCTMALMSVQDALLVEEEEPSPQPSPSSTPPTPT